jgi:L-cystine uptake protein TcyP (sodium:dicarboxylate symporter family)
MNNEIATSKSVFPVSGPYNGMFSADPHGALAAVIVNPAATPAQRLGWAMGQLVLCKTVAQAACAGVPGEAHPTASATVQLLEQSLAVIERVLFDMETPADVATQGPLRAV